MSAAGNDCSAGSESELMARRIELLKRMRARNRECDSMNEVLPGLFLGGMRAAATENVLDAHQIHAVLTIMSPKLAVNKRRDHLQVHLEDWDMAPLDEHFASCVNFIHAHRLQDRNVLVHCLMGVSRSATIVLAYVMTVTRCEMSKAFEFVKSQRHVISPNRGFLSMLRQLESDLSKEGYDILLDHDPAKHVELTKRDLAYLEAALMLTQEISKVS